MEILYGIIIAISALFLVMVLRLVTTFFHEMGHAIPALLFTDKQVDVFVGSYGNLEKALKLNFGRLQLFLKWNIFDWQIGLCRHSGVKELWKEIVIIIGGPIASLLIAIPIFINLGKIPSDSIWFFMGVVFFGAAILDLFSNLTPYGKPMQLYDGSVAYSDGMQLKMKLHRSMQPDDYFELEKKYSAKEYEEVVKMGNAITEENSNKLYAYEFVIAALEKMDKHEEIIEKFHQYIQHSKLDNSHYYQIGVSYKKLGQYKEALKYFNHCYHLSYADPNLLNEMAEIYLNLGDKEAALDKLDAAIYGSPKFQRSYKQRGLILINMGELDYAEADLGNALLLGREDPEVQYLLGYLNEKLDNISIAIKHFEQAKAQNYEHHALDYKLATLKSEIENED